MKTILPLALIGALQASAQDTSQIHFIRQQHLGTGVVWDMPVAASGSLPATPAPNKGNTLFQRWSIEPTSARESLRDQKLVGPYLPAADIRIVTLDPCTEVARTRVDQSFTVEINVSGLLSAADFPRSFCSVVLERHPASYQDGRTALDSSTILSRATCESAYLSDNGKTLLRFPASCLTAANPTKACGEEHFVIHALSEDGSLPQSQIAAGVVQVWPVASGEIKGISNDSHLQSRIPRIQVVLSDLYPRSDTYLLLFEGSQIAGNEGTVVKSHTLDGKTAESTAISVADLDSKISRDGTYTLALVSDTVYGRELLCKPVTFEINRNLPMSATARIDPVTCGSR